MTRRTPEEEDIDATLAESFPASDPPAWTTTHVGVPVGAPDDIEPGPETEPEIQIDAKQKKE